jgi:hypothetical protein
MKYYLNRHKYNVLNDYDEKKKMSLLYQYKYNALVANGFAYLTDYLPNFSPQFNRLKLDEEGFEEAVDVTDIYPMTIEEERREIINRTQNLEYLRKAHDTFEYCRTRCKLNDQRLRNVVNHPKENQMCVTDCLNIRFELFNKERPNSRDVNTLNAGALKNFIWLA